MTPAQATPILTVTRSYGSLNISAAEAGSMYLDGRSLGDLPAGAEARLDNIEVGARSLELRYAGGEKETKAVSVQKGRVLSVSFNWKQAANPAATAMIGATLRRRRAIRVKALRGTTGVMSRQARTPRAADAERAIQGRLS